MFLLVAALICGESLRRVELHAGPRRIRTIWLWKRRERPLEQLLAVQLAQCSISEKYYVHLVWDDEKKPRETLTLYKDGNAAREAGKALASFLGIPFLDEASEERAEESCL